MNLDNEDLSHSRFRSVEHNNQPSLRLYKPWFDEMYQSLLTELKAKANVTEITEKAAASALFSSDHKPVVLAADAGLARKESSELVTKAIQFVKDGGTLVFGLQFPSFATPPEIKHLFKAFGIPWESGDYHLTTFDVNTAIKTVKTAGLVRGYSQKALHLSNVEEYEAVYLPMSRSRIQSMVFYPSRVEDLTQTPAAFRDYGKGKLGYLGDVNAEVETNKVVLAMCGLLD